MSLPLHERTIALAEGRQLEELAALLEREGATALRYPLLSILDPPDDGPVLAWLDELIADRFAWLVLFTGEGVRRLVACAERHGRREPVVAAFGRCKTITRGPKPVRALKEIGLASTRVAGAPTTEGVIAALRPEPLQGLTVGVQLYRETNPPLTDFLIAAGATVRAVLPYVYAPASDGERVLELVRRMAAGGVDAVAFTSSPQVDRLFDAAQERQAEDELRRGLARTQVAAVGPVVADNLRQRGVHVAICPEQGFVMKNLVNCIKRALS
ncbi:MAG: uroporphyrinogen-III synthase [Gemmataceae bacterium]|nr:uroporphyrinogen-III synthase [Gemmataceae bacterium]